MWSSAKCEGPSAIKVPVNLIEYKALVAGSCARLCPLDVQRVLEDRRPVSPGRKRVGFLSGKIMVDRLTVCGSLSFLPKCLLA